MAHCRARAVFTGYPHHVTQRGNRRLRTFFEDSDDARCLDQLAGAAGRAGMEFWSYRLMSNHEQRGLLAEHAAAAADHLHYVPSASPRERPHSITAIFDHGVGTDAPA